VVVSESPVDLILSPGELSVPEQNRFLSMLADVRCYPFMSSIAFETVNWPRWLHPDRIGFVLLVSATQSKSTATMILTECLIRYCQKVGIPCLRFRQKKESSPALRNVMANGDVGLCFDRSLIDLNCLLDEERRPDLLVLTMARRAPSKLSSDLSWSIAICSWEERLKCMKFRRAQNDLALPVPEQIARVSQRVEDNKSLIVIIASSIWQQQVEVTISMIQRCKQQQIAVFLVHDEDFGEVAKFHAILSVDNDKRVDKMHDKNVIIMQELSERQSIFPLPDESSRHGHVAAVPYSNSLRQQAQQTSDSPPEDLILTPGELSLQEEARICKLLSDHRDSAIPSELHWVTSTKFKTAGWTQWINPKCVALVLLVCRTKQDPRTDISACVADYCRKVGIPCLRLRKHSEIEKDFLDTNIGITFHPCFLDVKIVLDPGRRLDLWAASTAARPLSPLITNKTWARLLCGLHHREQLEIFIALRQDRTLYEFTYNVAGEIAHVSKLVDEERSRLVLISASAWMQRFDETLSLIEMCKKRQVPVFLVHDKQFCYPPQFPAIFCLKNKTYARKFERVLRELVKRSRKLLGTAKVEDGPAEKATSPMEGVVVIPFNDASRQKELNNDPPTGPSLQETLVTSARVESIQSTVTRKRQRDDQDSPGSNEDVDAGILPISRSEDPPHQQQRPCVQTNVEEVVLGEIFQSVNVEPCVNTAVSQTTNSSQHGVDLVANDDDNATVKTKVTSTETFPHQDPAKITITDVSQRQIPLLQSETDVSMPTEKEIFLLEEAVSIFEGSLETLIARKDKVKANLSQEQDKRVHQIESVVNLQSRSEQLHTAQTRQFELEQELTRSIARSRAQLGRLTGHGSVLSTEDISELSGAEGDAHASGETPESSTTEHPEESVSDQPFQEEPNSARLLNHPIGTEKVPLNVPVEWHP
jgi:ribosomal protein L7Ae-like RNA K-turn-binding protein